MGLSIYKYKEEKQKYTATKNKQLEKLQIFFFVVQVIIYNLVYKLKYLYDRITNNAYVKIIYNVLCILKVKFLASQNQFVILYHRDNEIFILDWLNPQRNLIFSPHQN